MRDLVAAYFAALDARRSLEPWLNLQLRGAARRNKLAKLNRDLWAAEDALRAAITVPNQRP